MKEFKVIARFIMSFILAISIICFVLIFTLSNTVLSEKYIFDSLEKADYYNKTYESIESNFEKYIQQSGLDEDVLKNIVTKEQVEEDTKRIIISIFDGLHEDVSTQKLEETLKNNISKSINNRSLSTEEKKAIDEFTQQICSEYKTTIVNSNYESQINTTYKKVMNLINKFKKILIITIGACIIVLIILNLRRPYKILTNIAISFIASGFGLMVINIYINAKIKVQHLSILNDIISTIVRNITQDVLESILKYGILLVIVGLITSIVTNFVHNIIKYKSLMQDDVSKDE